MASRRKAQRRNPRRDPCPRPAPKPKKTMSKRGRARSVGGAPHGGRLRKARDAFGGVARDITVGVLSNLVSKQTGASD